MRLLTAILFALLALCGRAQAAPSYYFQRLDISDGLSQNSVNTILQDRNGFMWFGTRDGLNRYDGRTFKVFRNDFSQSPGLKNNFITSLFEDADSNIWIGTDVGVCIYYPDRERFEEFALETADGGKIERTVTKIGRGPGDRILIAVVNAGLFEYNPATGGLVYHDMVEKYGNVREFALDGSGRVWISSPRGLFYTDTDIEQLQRFRTADGSAPFGAEIISKIVFGSRNKMYLGSERNGVYEVNTVTASIRRLKIDPDYRDVFVRDIILYDDSRLWIGSEHGLYIYDTENDTSENLTSDYFDPYSISDNAVYSIYRDREQGVWIGSFFGGINYYSHSGPQFEKYYPTTAGNTLNGRRVREICGNADGSVLWIGTEDAGLFSFDAKSKNFTHFTPSSQFPNIHGLCFDGEILWAGTFSYGLKAINVATGAVKSYYANDHPATIMDNYIFSVCRASTGYIYFGTANFLIVHDKSDGSFRRVHELDGNLIYDIMEDSDGNLWLATYSNGIFFHDSKPGTWIHYQHTGQEGSLPINKILSVFEDSRKNIWVTTQGGGLCRFLPQSKTFEIFNSTNGLPNDVVFQVQEDSAGFLWLTTNKGLVKFDPRQSQVVKIYTVADGLPDGQFNYKSGYKVRGDNIYFGTTQGMISFSGYGLQQKENPAPAFITDFLIFNRPVPVGTKGSPLEKSITFSDKVTLKHNQNTFSLRISVLDYRAGRYRETDYMLEGADKQWIPLPESSVINYSNLPYGKYSLYVKDAVTTTPDGGEKLLDIEIRPPFYLTRTACLIYFLLSCGAVWLIYTIIGRRNRRRQQAAIEKFEQEKEKELYNSKIGFFTNITHEIRTPLTLIKGPLESILSHDAVTDRETAEDLHIMKMNVDRLQQLTDQMLDFRDNESQNMPLKYTGCNVSEVLKVIYKRFSPLARQRGYDFTLDIKDPGLQAVVDIDVFTKIVSNLFTNAIKYGDSYIRVSLDGNGEFFGVTVENDGDTFPADMKDEIFKPFVRHTTEKNMHVPGTGIGLSLAKSLAGQHNGSLTVDVGENRTCFTLTLPVGQETDIGQCSDPEENEPDFSAEGGNNSPDGRPTILLVEDDASIQKFVQRQLSKKYNVLVAGNGQQALEILPGKIVSLVVSDIMMPVMDGIRLCTAIKSDIDYCHIPVILLTAKTMTQSKIEGAEAGAEAYIEKPFSMEYLTAVIENLIQNRLMLKNTFSRYPTGRLSKMAPIAKTDEDFLGRIHDAIIRNISNPELKMEDIAGMLNMSRASFYRKIKGLLDLSPNEYLRIERLKEAARLLGEGQYQISEVCYMVGFNSLSYFSKCFYRQFSVLPKDFGQLR